MKTYLVTGASRGMGKAIAEMLVAEGHFVYGVFNTNQEEADRMKVALGKVEMIACDFSDRGQVVGLVGKLAGVSFDGIVNSAGVFVATDFADFDMAAWDRVFDVNVHAPLALIQGLQKQLVDGASIVNISSTDGMTGAISGMAYAASKAALINVSMSLANALSPRGIRVNAVAPGWIGDGMQAPPEILEEARKFNPLRRLGTYEDIANVVCFLLSEKAAYVNGTTVVADGGETATSYLLKKESEL